MIPAWIALIFAYAAFWLGFILCALFTIGRVQNYVPPPEDLTSMEWEAPWPTPYIEPKKPGGNNEKK